MNNLKNSKKFIVIIVLLVVVCGAAISAAFYFAGGRPQALSAAVGQTEQTQGLDNGGSTREVTVPEGSENGWGQETTVVGIESGSSQGTSGQGNNSVIEPGTVSGNKCSSAPISGKQPDTATRTSNDAKPGGNAAEASDELQPNGSAGENKDEKAVTALVEGFGKRLQLVSLLAPKDIVSESIEQTYKDYVTPELLRKWKADPENAPGRVGSSPWPDRIDILGIEPGVDDQYIVNGEIIEVTSVELVKGGAAAKRPVTLEVRKAADRWLIGAITLGEYVKRGPVVYENGKFGFDFYLPETWKGFKIVEKKWEGRNAEGIAETGPQLLIRHPGWTEKEPYQDIPVMIFTHEQWNALQNEEFYVSAAPIGPSKLGSNSKYVFALPPRYNYSFPKGYEEVEEIMSGRPLWPVNAQ